MPLGLVFQPSMGFNDLDMSTNLVNHVASILWTLSVQQVSAFRFCCNLRLQKPGSQKNLERPCLSLHHHPRNIFVKLALLPSQSPLVVAPSHVKMEGNASRTSSRFHPISYITRDGNLNHASNQTAEVWSTKKKSQNGLSTSWVSFTTVLLTNQIHQNQMHIHQIQSLHVIENGQVASGSALRKCCQSHGIGGCYPRPQWHIAKAHCLRHLLGHFTLRKLVFPGLFLMMILVISSGRVW